MKTQKTNEKKRIMGKKKNRRQQKRTSCDTTTHSRSRTKMSLGETKHVEEHGTAAKEEEEEEENPQMKGKEGFLFFVVALCECESA